MLPSPVGGKPGSCGAMRALTGGVQSHCRPLRIVLLVPTSSAKKGTEMLTRLVKLQSKLNNDRGATAVEYGLMVALIAIVIIVAVGLLGGNLSRLFQNVATSV